jgi:regulator of sigma E protease
MSEVKSPEVKRSMSTTIRVALVLLIAAAVAYLLATNFEKLGAILMVLFGFGGVIMVHEFGHFIVAKMTGMKVTAFSIGFSPVVLGLRRTAAGMRLRILPTLVPKDGGQPDEGALDMTIGAGGREWDTEYRLGLIPFGGFVALLGQEDVGVAEETNDPRSFTNKPLLPRIAVILAGVTFNVISALIIFMIIFHDGIRLQSPVIGYVIPDSPAQKAGLKPGDEVLSIDGDTFIDFTNITLAGALSGKGEPVKMVVKRTAADGKASEFPVSIVPESGSGSGMLKFIRVFGVGQVHDLAIGTLASDADRKELLKATGLMEKDVAVAVNGKPVSSGLEFDSIIENALTPTVMVTFDRKDPKTGQVSRHDIELPLELAMVTPDFEKEFTLNSVFGMVPRLEVAGLAGEPNGFASRAKRYISTLLFGKEEQGDTFLKGDIVTRVNDLVYPTFADLRRLMTDYTRAATAHASDPAVPFSENVTVVVERVVDGQPKEVTLSIKPQPAEEPNMPSLLGISAGIDSTRAIISRVIETPNGLKPGAIPAGATIVSVGGEKVGSFFDIIAAIRRNADRKVAIEWQKGQETGSASLEVPLNAEGITMRSEPAIAVPFDELRRPYKADGPGQAIVMGWKRTELFITQAVLTLEKLVSGALSPKTLSGPLGIVTATYKIAAEGKVNFYFYWLALLSASIAVMNLLPLPILDGGLIVLMIVEKIKGSPISLRVQAALNYFGLALIIGLMVYVTFNDIAMFFR